MINTKTLLNNMDEIKKELEIRDSVIKHLQDETLNLKDAAYKDAEVKRLLEENERLKADNRRGFPITEEESKKIKKWCKKHDAKAHGLTTSKLQMKSMGCSGGRYVYKFTPTGLGVAGEVICSCGASFEFQHIR